MYTRVFVSGCRLKCIESVLKLLSSEEKYSSDLFTAFLTESLPEVSSALVLPY